VRMRRSSILSKNFGVSATPFERTLDPREIYIFKAPVPGPLGPDKLMGAEPRRKPSEPHGAGEISEPVIMVHDN
jgi:hypothetical protein